MKRFAIAVILLFIARAESGDVATTEDVRLERLFKTYLETEFKHRPLEATRAGDHRFDDRLDDVSPKARAANTERARKMLADIPKRIDYKKLSRSGQIDFEIWRHELTKEIWLAENTDRFAHDPRTYNDYITESVYILLSQSTQPLAVNIRNANARIAAIPRIVGGSQGKPDEPAQGDR